MEDLRPGALCRALWPELGLWKEPELGLWVFVANMTLSIRSVICNIKDGLLTAHHIDQVLVLIELTTVIMVSRMKNCPEWIGNAFWKQASFAFGNDFHQFQTLVESPDQNGDDTKPYPHHTKVVLATSM